MVRAENPKWRSHRETTGLLTVLMLATVGIWMVTQGAEVLPYEVAQVGTKIAAFAASHDDLALVNISHKTPPFAMTIPLAVAKTQQMALPSLKRYQDVASNRRRVSPMKGAGGIFAGLALMQAAGGNSGH